MHLKKLIISGFKSFADKVTLNFDHGITGIVGPNGSGKSNVIDSVRWVMGEQNAKNLRGQIATDIIFAGSDKRKALGMAEVTLVIDNADASSFCPAEYRHEPEISLTRRLYSDGEREYLINRKPCRLKDIIGFFAMTGLGGRSYSMIQQGQVDRILNAKPEDVREILEEAAGTLVFKNRRQAALRKLENTNENLSRIEDILAELSRQVDALEAQVEKARKWKDLTGELKVKELALFGHHYAELREKLQEVTRQQESEVDQEVQFMADVASLDSRLEELQQTLNESDPELDRIREEVASVREQIVRAEGVIGSALEAIDNGRRRLEDIDAELAESGGGLQALEERLESRAKEISEFEQERQRLAEAVDDYQSEVDQAQEAYQVFQNRLDELDDEIKNLDHLLESNGLRCEAIERDRKRVSQEIERCDSRRVQLEADLRQAEAQRAEAQAKASLQQGGLDEELAKKQAHEDAIAGFESEIAQTREEKDFLREEYLSSRARLGSLEELEAGLSDIVGVYASLREADAAITEGVPCILADGIAFQESIKELPAPTVAAIEKWVERLVVRDFSAFHRLLDLSLELKKGGFAALVLSEQERMDGAAAEQWAQGVGAQSLAAHLTATDSGLNLGAVLKRLYYLAEPSREVLQTLPDGVVLFTANGVVISERRELFISHLVKQGLLSRKSEIETLAQRLGELEVTLAEKEEHLKVLEQKIGEEKSGLRSLEEALRNQNKDVLEVMGALQSATQQFEHKQQLLTDTQQQKEELEKSGRGYVKELEELSKSRVSLGSERENLVQELDSLQEESSQYRERNEEVARVFEQKRLDLAKFEARYQGMQENYEQVKSQVDSTKAQLGRRSEEKTRIAGEIEKAQTTEQENKELIQDLIMRREELEEQLAEKREQNAGIIEEMQVVENKLKEARKKQSELQEAKARRSFEIEKAKLAMDGLMEQATEKYHLDLSAYEFERDPNFNTEKTTKEVQSLRSKIEGIGAINMMAIEEYERLTERFQFISSQREEVISSIRLIEEAIFEIEETAKEKFFATFQVIDNNFRELFPILFPGGEGKLDLTDANDPLNAGVDILVRLPGKKQQSMSLFSGGEKALTAISLIFALLKTKPTPFCFLDEVDAPLDEANVGRYNRVLEALSDRFQFIVITHNRRTMEVLDQLYGVTMQEGGVSKVVGVDMKKDLPAHLKKAFKQEQAEPTMVS